MEETKLSQSILKTTIIKSVIKHASTYGPTTLNTSLEKKKKKKVVFIDRVKNLNLCTVFNYEQVDLLEEESVKETTSCACLVI